MVRKTFFFILLEINQTICAIFTFIFLLQIEDAQTIVYLTEEMDSVDTALLQEAMSTIKDLNKALDQFELTQLLSGPYDKEGAVISITAGAGGTDAQVNIILFNDFGRRPI